MEGGITKWRISSVILKQQVSIPCLLPALDQNLD